MVLANVCLNQLIVLLIQSAVCLFQLFQLYANPLVEGPESYHVLVLGILGLLSLLFQFYLQAIEADVHDLHSLLGIVQLGPARGKLGLQHRLIGTSTPLDVGFEFLDLLLKVLLALGLDIVNLLHLDGIKA